MNGIQIFNNEEFGQIRTVDINGKTHFVAGDIAKALGYVNIQDAIKRHCRWVAKHDVPHPQSPGKMLEVNVIPEGDIYRLVAHSELDSAVRFESWVFDKLLPSIRQSGTYSSSQKQYLDFLQGLLDQMKEQEAGIRLAQEQSLKAIETTQIIKDKIIGTYENWREEMRHLISGIQRGMNKSYQETYNTLYDALEKRARCDLSTRVRNGRDRLLRTGATKAKVEDYGRLDVIEADPRLKEIFTTIVKEYAIKCA